MKRFGYLFLILCVFTSCSKESDPLNPDNPEIPELPGTGSNEDKKAEDIYQLADIVFDVKNGSWTVSEPILLDEHSVTNSFSEMIIYPYTFKEKSQDYSLFSVSSDLPFLPMLEEIVTRIPYIGWMNEEEVLAEPGAISRTFNIDKKEIIDSRNGTSYSDVRVPPYSKITLTSHEIKYLLSVPYKATLTGKDTGYQIEIEGEWTGSSRKSLNYSSNCEEI